MSELEIEIKAVIDTQGPFDGSSEKVMEVQRNLVRLGAKPTGSYIHTDTYFSHPCRDLSVSDEAIRIRCQKRVESDSCDFRLTYKGPKVSEISKAREEVEMELEDPEKMRTILEKLGFGQVMEVVKHRTFLELGKIDICLDMIEELGYFLEVELMSDDVKATEQKLLEMLKELGLANFERRSYLELLLEKQV